MGTRDLLFIGLVIGSAAAVGASLYPPRVAARPDVKPVAAKPSPGDDEFKSLVRRLDESFQENWKRLGLTPAASAPEPLLLRRLALSLTGSIPSLEELRKLETVTAGERVSRYIDLLLDDRRFADYFAERLARAYVGTEGGPFLIYRRRRFVSWLSDQLNENKPYDQVVRLLLDSNGLWTDRPATNFLTVTYDPEKKVVDPDRLAGRVARAFLGVRIDCAQCHDHPFANWKQRDFQGLAAFFGQAQNSLRGIHEEPGDYQPTDRKTGKPKTVAPRVPFLPELLPAEGKLDRRVRLARWVTDAKNHYFPRATVNRVWALMFGKPLIEPVDDVGNTETQPEALKILAEDFVAHGYDMKRLIMAIAQTEVFRLDSELQDEESADAEREWSVFPITRLRPEQVVGSLVQAASLTTIDADSPILVRIAKSLGQAGFIQRFGDSGDDEFDDHPGTIPQRLLLLNGDLVRDKTKPDLFNAGNRIGWFAATDKNAVEIAYRTVLTRAPTPEEARHFEAKLAGTRGEKRNTRMSDLMWTLVNSTEFSWNH